MVRLPAGAWIRRTLRAADSLPSSYMSPPTIRPGTFHVQRPLAGNKNGADLSTPSPIFIVVGVTGFEPAASSSRTTRATKLRHTPIRCPAQNFFKVRKSNLSRIADMRPHRETARVHSKLGRTYGTYEARLSAATATWLGGEGRRRQERAVSVSRTASGRQAKRKGAAGEVPMPPETLTGEVRPRCSQSLSPLARQVGRSQLVTRAP